MPDKLISEGQEISEENCGVLKYSKKHAHLGPIWYHSEPSDIPYTFIPPSTFGDFAFFALPSRLFQPPRLLDR